MRKVINKIYVNFKNYIKENYKYIIFIIFFSVFCFYNTGYSIYRPGGIINSSIRVSGDNLYKSKGSFNMAYISMTKGRLPFYLLAKIIPSWELIKNEQLTINDLETIEEARKRERLYYEESMTSAMYVALKKANQDFEVESEKFYILFKTPENDSVLEVGDEILSYDGIEFTSTDNFIKYINSKKDGYVIKIKYKETNGKIKETTSTIYEKDDGLLVGLSIIKLLNIKSNHNIEIKSKSSESGPSGGFITALSIYDALTKEDLTRGKKIVGTGTINYDGEVGEIGSVNQKLDAAVKKHADIFLCPKNNYDEVNLYAKEKKYDIIIKSIANFDEAILYLNSLED